MGNKVRRAFLLFFYFFFYSVLLLEVWLFWGPFHRTCHQWQLVIHWLLPWQQCFIANQNQECHFICQWMTNCHWWQVLWNGPLYLSTFLWGATIRNGTNHQIWLILTQKMDLRLSSWYAWNGWDSRRCVRVKVDWTWGELGVKQEIKQNWSTSMKKLQTTSPTTLKISSPKWQVWVGPSCLGQQEFSYARI